MTFCGYFEKHIPLSYHIHVSKHAITQKQISKTLNLYFRLVMG